jgi:hypothetical protein
LYPLAGLLAWMGGGNPYRDNLFEREARAAESAEPGKPGRTGSAAVHSVGR